MPGTLALARGPAIFLVAPESVREFRLAPSRGGPARPGHDLAAAAVPPALREELRRAASSGGLRTFGARAATGLSELAGTAVSPVSVALRSEAVRRLPRWGGPERRTYFLALARSELDRGFRSPEETVISLAREEERFERAVERERKASEAFVGPAATPLAEHAAAWSGLREQMVDHHRALRRRLESAATDLLPNLSEIVGPRVAARLLAAAGGVAPLARIASSRLQLLGARRRPSPERGPRFGAIYRAEPLVEVPPDRRAAFARSLASAAVIAARADLTTGGRVAPALRARLARRAEQLRRGRS